MKVISIGKGNTILKYESVASSYCKIMKTEEATNIGIISIEPNGILVIIKHQFHNYSMLLRERDGLEMVLKRRFQLKRDMLYFGSKENGMKQDQIPA